VGVAASELSEGWNSGFVVCSPARKTTESEGVFAFGELGILYADVRIYRFEFERKKRMAALIELR
jgi:hypothetical protein